MTDETQKRQAYSLAMKLKRQGLGTEVILARMEKQGIPKELSIRVLSNMNQEAKKVSKKEEVESLNVLLVVSGIIIAICILSFFLFPDVILVPSGIGAVGIVVGILGLVKRKSKP